MAVHTYGRTSEPPECGPTLSRLTREQLLDRIMTLNPTATSEFLSRFGDDDLDEYLTRLTAAQAARGRTEREAPAHALSGRTAGE